MRTRNQIETMINKGRKTPPTPAPDISTWWTVIGNALEFGTLESHTLDIHKRYHALRKPYRGIDLNGQPYVQQWLAQRCLDEARYQVLTEFAWNWLEAQDLVKFEIKADPDYWDLDDLFGDTYDPEVNDDFQASKLERARQDEVDRIERLGVVCAVGYYRLMSNDEWLLGDSMGGFVDKPYHEAELDIKRETLRIGVLQ